MAASTRDKRPDAAQGASNHPCHRRYALRVTTEGSPAAPGARRTAFSRQGKEVRDRMVRRFVSVAHALLPFVVTAAHLIAAFGECKTFPANVCTASLRHARMACAPRRQWVILRGGAVGRVFGGNMAAERERILPMFGVRLGMLRLQAGLDQEELASVIDAHHNRISRFERQVAMPKAWELVRLAKYFGVSTDSLLGLTEKFEAGIIPTPPKRPRKLPKRERRVPLAPKHGSAAP